MHLSLRARVILLLSVTILTLAAYWLIIGAHKQDPTYHAFADDRTMAGVPNALNVLSNSPFVVVGAVGLWFMASRHSRRPGVFLTRIERAPFWVYFAGLVMTGIGSAYYHAHPNNETLTWDRMFLAITFMALFTAMLAERVHLACIRCLLWPLVAFGAGSVLYWQYTERIGAGDLRFYFTAQFFPLLMLPLLLIFCPPRYTRTGDLVAMLLSYVLAKIVEILDAQIYTGAGFVSGHTLKHLIAGLTAAFPLLMLWHRRPLVQEPTAIEPVPEPALP
jgi:hypothetical protein